jgi:TRAP-type C4-dicarboxylate transport system permease small subunit
MVKALPSHVQPWVNLTADFLTLALMVIIMWYGGILTWRATQVTATLNVPQYIIYIVVPASGVLGFLHSLGDFRCHLREALTERQVT